MAGEWVRPEAEGTLPTTGFGWLFAALITRGGLS